MRVKITLSYNGAYFEGFQRQAHTKNTIIDTLCEALRSLGIFQIPIGSGRTDAKVHAIRQTLHLDLPDYWSDLNHLKQMLNRYINPALHVKSIQESSAHFHARFHATSRHYRYIIWHGECMPALSNSVTFMPQFSVKKANQALSLMQGEHDFALFKKEGSEIKNSKRVLYEAFCYRYKNMSIFSFKANGFLRSQVRLMVGASLAFAQDKLTYEDLVEQLNCKKLHFKRPAPPQGLYLARIYYPL